jgi:hypothetical protein
MDNEDRENQFLERYKSFFEFPVIEKPSFLHTSDKILIPGDKIEVSRAHSCYNKYYSLEMMFEEIREREFPKRPSRLASVFLWPKEGHETNLMKLITPTEENGQKILRRFMRHRSLAFCYAARIPKGSNVFYANWSTINSLMEPYSLVDNRMFNTPSFEMMNRKVLRGYIENYWGKDMINAKEKAEVLVGGDVEIEGITPFEFVE